MKRTSGFSVDYRSIYSAFLFATHWLFHCMIFQNKILVLWGKTDWTLILHLLILYFLAIYILTPATVSGVEERLLFLSFFPLSIVSVAVVRCSR